MITGNEKIGELARIWDRLRCESVAAKKARADSRAALGPCVRHMPEDASKCYQLSGAMVALCRVCQVQAPFHKAYHAAVRKSSAALIALRREIRRGNE